METNAIELYGLTSLDHLSAAKLQELDTILKSILALPIARDTYAQIIDGKLQGGTTAVSGQPNSRSKASKQYEDIRKVFTANVLKLDTQLVQSYQNARLDSREHSLRLLEITAASVNTLAGTIYAFFHPDTDIRPRASHETADSYIEFFHASYVVLENYPFGLLDAVGYWAETQIFGGVLLFDRGYSGSKIDSAFIHPNRSSCALQISAQQMTHFLNQSKSGNAAHPLDAEVLLPFTQGLETYTKKAWVRVGETSRRIYKYDYDKWPLTRFPEPRSRCVINVTSHEPTAVKKPQPSLANRRSDEDGASR